MIKAIFFDIDGTLLNSQQKMLESTTKALKKLRQKGIICGIATGRGKAQIPATIDQKLFDVFVTYNGQLVFTPRTNIYQRIFPKSVVEHLASYADRHGREALFGTENSFSGSGFMKKGQGRKIPTVFHYIPKSFASFIVRKGTKWLSKSKKYHRYEKMNLLEKDIFQCVMISSLSETEALRKEFPECDVTRSSTYTIDIIPKGGSKLVGIQKALEFFELELSQTMVFGDSWNDLEMIESAGIGIAMGNGNSEVHKVAKDITTSNDHNGIYEALLKHKIIEKEE